MSGVTPDPGSVAPDVAEARTLPGRLYGDEGAHARLLERAFARSWQPLEPAPSAVRPGDAVPFRLLEGSLDEPLLALRNAEGELSVLSNVCTHRGHLLRDAAGPADRLRCRYHGRTFGCDGKVLAAPGFEQAAGFPAASDHLPVLRSARWGPLTFVALPGAPAFETALAPALARLGEAALARAVLDPERSRDYEVAASWIAYVDNYLEGLHIPFVHGALRAVLDMGAYRTEVLPEGVLQLGVARAGEVTLSSSSSATGSLGPDVAAAYLWLWPNLMVNLYPWGLSLNVVEPLGAARTRVRFRSYVRDASLLATGAGAALHETELEDESVVERVQIGVRSRLYDRGRFSPTFEAGVHAFHRRIATALA